MIIFLISWFVLSIISLIWGLMTKMRSVDRKWKFIVWTITVIPSGLIFYYYFATKTAYEEFLISLRSLKGGF